MASTGALRRPSWRPPPGTPRDPALLARLPQAVRSLVEHLSGVWLDGALHIRGAEVEPAWHSLAAAWDAPDAVPARLGLPASDIPIARTTFGDELVVRGHDVLRIEAGTRAAKPLGTSIGGLVAELERDPARLLLLDPARRTHRPEWEDLLEFWFEDCGSRPHRVPELVGRWFGGGDDFDAALRERFAPLLERAEAGDAFDDWRATPRGTVAAVLVHDQLPRNLRRGEARAWALDSRACRIAEAAIEDGVDQRVRAIEALFLYLPFEHAESLAHQHRCVAAFERLCDRAPEDAGESFVGFQGYAQRHLAVIERFGRFPHRNEVLGRTSRPEEERYLAEGGERF